MTTTMPALNGIPPPLSPSQTTTTKRKREDSHQPIAPDTPHNQRILTNSHPDIRIGESIQDIYHILQRHDTIPSVLQYTAPALISRNGTDSNEPAVKRTKISPASAVDSISTKVLNDNYKSLGAFASDIEASCSDLLFEARSKMSGAQWEYAPTSLDQDRLIAAIISFQELANTLVNRELARHKSLSVKYDMHARKSPKEDSPNGVKIEANTDGPELRTEVPNPRTVLTLFGNAQGHKQLFSSLQRPNTNPIKSEDSTEDASITALGKVVVPVRENGLPNGISSTRIISTPHKNTSMLAKSATVLDVFAPPTSTLPLVPPKTPRPALGRQSSLTWTRANTTTASKAMIGYAHQKLIAGQWLGYDGLIPSHDAASPETKRRQRDRTLSTGESGAAPSEATIAVQTQAREEALFRSVYSSFAPCRDNTGAIFPEEARNQIWWQKVGSHYMEETMQADMHPSAPRESQIDPALEGEEDEEAAFKKAVESFEPDGNPAKTQSETSTSKDKDGDALLQEISEMLEHLHSFQRIRNSSLNTNARSSVGQNPSLQDLMGSPSVPSTAELETYNVLKAQLGLIITLLPPYAVAKLNGEQIEELQISQRMPVESPSYRGVMEDDQASRAAKAAAFNAAIGSVNMQSRQNPVMTPAALQYSSGQARTAQMSGSSRSNTQQYYGGVPPSLSRNSSSFTRQSLSAWQSPAQSYNTPTTQRPAYASQPSYGQQQTPRPLPTASLRAPMSQYPPSRSTSGNQQINGTYSATTPSQPAYQQRAQNYAANTNYNFKPSYTAAAYNAAQTPSNHQYSRASYLNTQPQPQPPPPTSVSPVPAVGSATHTNGPRPPTPTTVAQAATQTQSPVAAPPPALVPEKSESRTPQP